MYIKRFEKLWRALNFANSLSVCASPSVCALNFVYACVRAFMCVNHEHTCSLSLFTVMVTVTHNFIVALEDSGGAAPVCSTRLSPTTMPCMVCMCSMHVC